jgi:hypothetical protein
LRKAVKIPESTAVRRAAAEKLSALASVAAAGVTLCDDDNCFAVKSFRQSSRLKTFKNGAKRVLRKIKKGRRFASLFCGLGTC